MVILNENAFHNFFAVNLELVKGMLVMLTHEGTCGSEDTTPIVFNLGSTVK
jgi:hypothetical protein